MALLLCTRDARNPFYNEKLDIRIWSLQELCYVIYNHPLLTLHGFVTPELADWLRDELSMGFLAARIRQLMASAPGEGEEDQLDHHGEEDHRDAVAAGQVIEQPQQPHKGGEDDL